MRFPGYLISGILILSTSLCQAQFPLSFQKISATQGNLGQPISFGAKFGIKSAAIGDLNEDGITDVVIGATNQGGDLRGSAFVILLKPDGTALSSVEIPSPEIFDLDSFGSAVAGLGDLNNDGVEDIAVGAGYDNQDGSQRGAMWIFFLNSNGTVKSSQKINSVVGNFTGTVDPGGNFGTGAAGLGDLDGDGVEDLAVGADLDNGSGTVFILFLNTNGTVKSHQEIGNLMGGFPNILFFEDYFGYGLGNIGDLDGDGVTDLAIGAHRTDDGGTNRGAVHIVFLNSNGTVKNRTKISAFGGGFIEPYTTLGVAATGIGDFDNDGVRDLIVGSNDAANDGGVIWYLMMNANGSVKSYHKISNSSGGTNLALDPGDFFGGSLVFLGDIDNDGLKDVGVGAFNDDDGGTDKGAFWISVPNCTGISHAGDDITSCDSNQTALAANTPGLPGTWSLAAGSGTIVNPANPITAVTNLGQGINKFVWDIGASTCLRRDTVSVFVSSLLSAEVTNDSVYTCTDQATVQAVKPAIGSGKWEVTSGQAAIQWPDSVTTAVQLVNRSPVFFTWKVTSTGCPSKEAKVTVYPFDIVESDFPNVITPNGDGKNDTWKILTSKPATAFVRIFNRWGIQVYESPSYPNTWSGTDLSEGVYYYRLMVNGCTNEIKGTVQIIR